MSIRFDLTDLRLFVHVAEAGSITHGAARANMTLASASERIRAMEDALSAPLLERKRRGVQLTSAGRVLLHHAWVVTQQLEQMRGELANFGKGLRGMSAYYRISARWNFSRYPWRLFSLPIRISTSSLSITEAARLFEQSPRAAAISALSERALIQAQSWTGFRSRRFAWSW